MLQELEVRTAAVGMTRKPLHHATKPFIEEWILNSQTIVYWKTLVAFQDLKVVLQWTQQCSLRHVDTNPTHSAHILHLHVHVPTFQSRKPATS